MVRQALFDPPEQFIFETGRQDAVTGPEIRAVLDDNWQWVCASYQSRE
jgi:hypothetical protein